MENIEGFIKTSARAFRNRATASGDRAASLIAAGEYSAAIDALAEAVRYDGIAKEYEFIIEAEEWL